MKLLNNAAIYLTIMVSLLVVSTTAFAAQQPTADDATQEIYVAIGILDVDAINSADQSFTLNLYVQFRWQDDRLAHPGPDSIRRQLTEIHAPRFLLVNRQRTWSSLLNVVDISPQGEAVFRMRLWGDFSQIMKMQDFPFDSHTFQIPVMAIPSTQDKVVLLPDPKADSFMADQLSVADWTISGWSAGAQKINTGSFSPAAGYVFSFEAKRLSGHYLIKYIIPLFLIVAMSWVVFWIDPTESASQLSVAVTAILTLIAYHIALTGKLPDISYLTRMDLFLFGSTLLVFSSLIQVVFTSRLARLGRLKSARRSDIICRVGFPASYALIAYLTLIGGLGASF